MTKFILVGGIPIKTEGGGKALCEEVVEGFDQPVRILDCIFARPQDMWKDKLEHDRFLFASHLRQKVILTLAISEDFIAQLQKTDVVYFKGGNTSLLMETLAAIPDWEKELAGKTVVGNSAGVNFLAEYYYGLNETKLCKGLGILPIKALVHYRSDYNAPNIDWDKAYAELEAIGDPAMEIITLEEEEFKVFEV